ncbi:[acyl-carrier-protein] S-malonyltransferase [Ignavibacterium album JCM 16511]|uniref:Malonyl CoA-acyl carrier protein transacylase n=1 Tax=Ignavibacterium album (strain DSM 19864 / JCM 16511 / NBRC 101810 / Mat9-16) TaxID=945713 RepID=I0AL40_IGNAJ|nr:ACP S-malonyltransferase [Ignavibacterium album]AFH49697.1 [acyl-carrier-protein] S-malonyltransferase [Ignavibacterium album JCM 16511]
MAKKAFLFPGQGSQYVGMAKDLFNNSVEAKEMIRTADEAVGANLSYIMFNGPEEELKQTEFTQPAIFLHSVVLASLIRTLRPDAAAGHSLGEYSALVAAGAIQFYEAVKLVRQRGLAMQYAGTVMQGTMAAIVGLQPDVVENLCNEASAAGVVQCANFNSPGQIVISGSVNGVKKAMELCKLNGAKLVKELVVSGAFHSPLMEPAKERLQKALNETNFYNARFPVYTNVTAKPVTDKNEIRKLLFEQLTSPVRWEETIRNMISDGIEEFYEIGPGKVLQGLVKRINPDVKVFGIDKYEDVYQFI